MVRPQAVAAALALQLCCVDAADCGTFTCAAGSVLVTSPASVTCAAATCTQAECCLSDCAVPTVTGAASTGCTEGASVVSGTTCTWSVESGYTCTNAPSTLTCTNGAFPATPACTGQTCAAFTPATYNVNAVTTTACDAVPEGSCAVTCVTGYDSGAGTQNAALSCGAGQVWAVTPSCVLSTCSSAATITNQAANAQDYAACNGKTTGQTCQPNCNTNYQAVGTVTLTCGPTGDFDAQGTTATCNAIVCSVAFSAAEAAAANVNVPGSTTACDAVIEPACALTCVNYYTGAPQLSCTAIDTWTVSPACTDACSTADAAATFTVPSAGLPTGADLSQCGVGKFSATTTTCNVPCSTGYTEGGTTTVQCGTTGTLTLAAAQTLTCTEKQCVAYIMPQGFAAGTCTAVASTVTLNQVSAPTTCTLACDAGYTSAGSGVLTCTACGSTTCASSTSLTCTAVTCASAFDFATNNIVSVSTTGCDTVPDAACTSTCASGYSSAGTPTINCQDPTSSGTGSWAVTNPCTATACTTPFPNTAHNLDGLTVTACDTVPEGSCAATCKQGYSGTNVQVSCTAGGVWSVAPTCAENSCASFDYTATVGAGAQAAATNPCSAPETLSTNTKTSCNIECKAGYASSGSGTATCAATANAGDAATLTLTCTETCSLHTCGTYAGGQVRLKNTPTSTSCPCSDATCCAGVIVSPTSLTTKEKASGTGTSTATFTVTLLSQPTGDASITVTSGDTTEGTLSASPAGSWGHAAVTGQTAITLVFQACCSSYSTPQTVTVTGVDDAVMDDDQTYVVDVAAVVAAADANYNGLNPLDVHVTNVDNERTDTSSLSLTLPSETPTSTASASLPSATASGSATTTLTPPATASRTETFTETGTATVTRTVSATVTATSTSSLSSTRTASVSATATLTETETATATDTATQTRTVSLSSSATVTVSATITLSSTDTATATATQTRSPTYTPSVTSTATESATQTESSTATATESATTTRSPTYTPSVTATDSLSRTATVSVSVTATGSATATETLTETATVSVTRSLSASVSMPTATATATQSVTLPTATPTPSLTYSLPTATLTLPTGTLSSSPTLSMPTQSASVSATRTVSLKFPRFTPTKTPSRTPSPTMSRMPLPTRTAVPTLTTVTLRPSVTALSATAVVQRRRATPTVPTPTRAVTLTLPAAEALLPLRVAAGTLVAARNSSQAEWEVAVVADVTAEGRVLCRSRTWDESETAAGLLWRHVEPLGFRVGEAVMVRDPPSDWKTATFRGLSGTGDVVAEVDSGTTAVRKTWTHFAPSGLRPGDTVSVSGMPSDDWREAVVVAAPQEPLGVAVQTRSGFASLPRRVLPRGYKVGDQVLARFDGAARWEAGVVAAVEWGGKVVVAATSGRGSWDDMSLQPFARMSAPPVATLATSVSDQSCTANCQVASGPLSTLRSHARVAAVGPRPGDSVWVSRAVSPPSWSAGSVAAVAGGPGYTHALTADGVTRPVTALAGAVGQLGSAVSVRRAVVLADTEVTVTTTPAVVSAAVEVTGDLFSIDVSPGSLVMVFNMTRPSVTVSSTGVVNNGTAERYYVSFSEGIGSAAVANGSAVTPTVRVLDPPTGLLVEFGERMQLSAGDTVTVSVGRLDGAAAEVAEWAVARPPDLLRKGDPVFVLAESSSAGTVPVPAPAAAPVNNATNSTPPSQDSTLAWLEGAAAEDESAAGHVLASVVGSSAPAARYSVVLRRAAPPGSSCLVRFTADEGWRSAAVWRADTELPPRRAARRWLQRKPAANVSVAQASRADGGAWVTPAGGGREVSPFAFRSNDVVRVRDTDREDWRVGTVTSAGAAPDVKVADGTERGWLHIEPLPAPLRATVLARNVTLSPWSGGTAVAREPQGMAVLSSGVLTRPKIVAAVGFRTGDEASVRDSDGGTWNSASVDSTTTAADAAARGYSLHSVPGPDAAANPTFVSDWPMLQPPVFRYGDAVRVRDSDTGPWRTGGVVGLVGAQAAVQETGGSEWAFIQPCGYGSGDSVSVRAAGIGSVWQSGVVTKAGLRPAVQMQDRSVGTDWSGIRPAASAAADRAFVRNLPAAEWVWATAGGTDGATWQHGDAAAQDWALVLPAGFRVGQVVMAKAAPTASWTRGTVAAVDPLTVREEAAGAALNWSAGYQPADASLGDCVVVRDQVGQRWRVGTVTRAQDSEGVVQVRTEPSRWVQTRFLADSTQSPTAPPTVAATPPPIADVWSPVEVTVPTAFLKFSCASCVDAQALAADLARRLGLPTCPADPTGADSLQVAAEADGVFSVTAAASPRCPLDRSAAQLADEVVRVATDAASKADMVSAGFPVQSAFRAGPLLATESPVRSPLALAASAGTEASDDNAGPWTWLVIALCALGVLLCGCAACAVARRKQEQDRAEEVAKQQLSPAGSDDMYPEYSMQLRDEPSTPVPAAKDDSVDAFLHGPGPVGRGRGRGLAGPPGVRNVVDPLSATPQEQELAPRTGDPDVDEMLAPAALPAGRGQWGGGYNNNSPPAGPSSGRYGRMPSSPFRPQHSSPLPPRGASLSTGRLTRPLPSGRSPMSPTQQLHPGDFGPDGQYFPVKV